MKKPLLAAIALFAIQAPVHALIGIGVSGGLNSTSISAKSETVDANSGLPAYFTQGASPSLSYQREKVSGLTQVGLKAWLELPLIPVEFELGTNLAWGSYKSGLYFTHDGKIDTIPVDVPSPLALGDKSGSTPYVSLLTDATIRYPLLKFPPVINILKLYVGAGVTHVMATRVIDKKDLQSTFGSGTYSNNPADANSMVKDNLLQSTFGGHLSVGAQVKVPVVPIAFYVDGKWYMHTAVSDAASGYPFTISAGAGFAL